MGLHPFPFVPQSAHFPRRKVSNWAVDWVIFGTELIPVIPVKVGWFARATDPGFPGWPGFPGFPGFPDAPPPNELAITEIPLWAK